MKKMLHGSLQRIQNSSMWQSILSWYEQRAPGDQLALQGMGVAFAVVATYFFLWQPITDWSQKQEADYLYQKENSLWLSEHLNKAVELQNHSPKGDVAALISKEAQAVGVTLAKVRPDRSGLAVWVEDAAYQKLLKWLVLLQTQHRISVQQIRIDSLPGDGRVKSYVVFGA